MKELIHFAHGNGFPSPCYRQLLEHLNERFDYCYIERVGHAPKFPVTENWTHLVDEVINSIKLQSTEPVIAVGHSLGGVLSLLAAIEQPSLVKCVILLDAPLLGRFKSSLLRFAKAMGMIDRITPAHRSRSRQQHWHTREQVFEYLKSKPLFQTFTEACLNDYIDYGLQKNEKGYSLCFDREVEVQIYRTIPHILPEYEGKLHTPTALIYGSQSNMIGGLELRYMKKHFDIDSFITKGTHMFPMEHPKEVAELIINVVDKIMAKPSD